MAHIDKYSRQELRRILKETYREYDDPTKYENDVDVSRSHLNYNMNKSIHGSYDFMNMLDDRVEDMNDFLNHLVAQNTVFVQAEKDISIFIFRFLQELGYAHLLYKPNKADYALYWEKDCIVVTDMISEAPLSASAPHEICLEKMLVDMYCDTRP